MVRRLAIMLWLLMWHSLAHAASLEAKVDRTTLRQDEHVVFTLSLINSETRLRAEGIDPNVDLSLLTRDFDLGVPRADNRYNIHRGQGRSTSSITVELFPRRSGELTIPSFRVAGLRSQPLRLRVTAMPGDTPPAIFARAGLDVGSPWAGQQTVVHLDVYHRIGVDKASLGDNLRTEPTLLDLMPHWQLPTQTRRETVRGLDYEVERIAWSLFPPPGRLTITLPDVWIVTRDGDRRRLPSQQLTLTARPLPAGVTPDTLIGRVQLNSENDLPATLTQNQLARWTLTLRAPVQVTSLPEYLPDLQLPDGLRLYLERAHYDTETTSRGIVDVARYNLGIMPLRPGRYQLPPVRVSYFDPASGRIETAELPGRTLEVDAAATANATQAPPSTRPAGNVDTAAPAATTFTVTPWQIATIVFAALWLLTLGWALRRAAATAPTTSTQPITPAPVPTHPDPTIARLLQALHSQTLQAGLDQWERTHGHDDELRAVITALQQRQYGKDKPMLDDGRVEALIRRLHATASAQVSENPWAVEKILRR